MSDHLNCGTANPDPLCPDCQYKTEAEKAAREVLYLLKSPLALMSIPDRARAYDLANKYGITAVDLLDVATHAARNK